MASTLRCLLLPPPHLSSFQIRPGHQRLLPMKASRKFIGAIYGGFLGGIKVIISRDRDSCFKAVKQRRVSGLTGRGRSSSLVVVNGGRSRWVEPADCNLISAMASMAHICLL